MVSKTGDKLPRQTSRIKMRAEWVELADYLAEIREIAVPEQNKEDQLPYGSNKEQVAQQQSAGIASDYAPRFSRFHDECASAAPILGGELLTQEENSSSLWHKVDLPFVFAILVSLVGATVIHLVL